MKKKVIIFVSGNGSNMENIITYFNKEKEVEISSVFSNKPDCIALKKANKYNIPTVTFTKNELENGFVLDLLHNAKPDLIILAGFLLKIPSNVANTFPNKIINVHPSLLPKYGGKGMYGTFVHEAVIKNKEKESGITIHYVNENYDEGAIIAQFSCSITDNTSVSELQKNIHSLEHKHFPEVIENILLCK